MAVADGSAGRRNLALWITSAAIVFAIHGGIAAIISSWRDPFDPGGAASAIIIDMAPIAAESAAEFTNVPIGELQPEQTAIESEVLPEVEEPEQVRETKAVKPVEAEPAPLEQVAEAVPLDEPPPPLPPTPPVTSEVTLPPEAAKPVAAPPPPPQRQAIAAAAPERADRVAPRQRAMQTGAASVNRNVMQSYAVNVIRPHLMRHISSAGLSESGVVEVTFAITRQGRLVSRRVSRSSGYSDIDSAALATLQRAQPFPPPPLELTQQSFVFTLPVRYNVR